MRDLLRHLAGQAHLEAGIADPPCDEIAGVRNGRDTEILERDALGLAETRLAAHPSPKSRALRITSRLEVSCRWSVQSSRLTTRTLRRRLGPDDVMGDLQGVDGGGAAHEPHHGALDGRVEAQALHDLLVEPRRGEAGAGGHDHMGDGREVLSQVEGLDGLLREVDRMGLEALHAGPGAGELPGLEEALLVGRQPRGSRWA